MEIETENCGQTAHTLIDLKPNVTLAPEEQNVYRSNYESKTCAPAERDVSGNGIRHRLTFRSSGARRNLLEVARSINITSLRDQGNRLENLVKTNKKLDLCITDSNLNRNESKSPKR